MSVQTSSEPIAADPGPDRPLSPLPPHWRSLARAFVHRAREMPRAPALADSTGVKLSYGETLMRAAALGRVLARTVGPAPYVGVMIPPMVPSAVANVALTLRGKIPVNLNYTAAQAVVDSSIDQCGITHTVTSRRVLEKFKIEPKGELVFLEDLPKRVSALDKAWALMVARAVPIGLMGAFLPGLRGDDLDRTATVIFTSGSTGDPKGVVLSHRNILSNVHAVDQAVELRPDEVILNILPLFHSFGFTIGLWTVLCLGKKAVHHLSPLDARVVGTLCQEHGATVLFGTPTFLRGYLKKCSREQFATIRLLVLGAEKLKPELAREIRETLGVEPLEGYGCTELSPVVSVNVPGTRRTPDGREVPGNRPGTVGMPLPGTAIKTVDPETGADLPRGAEGLIHARSPQVMVGYLNRPEATAQAVRDGWYNTGDLGFLDGDGFLKITDRLSRFAKIGGEMVPHLGVEAAILAATGADEQAVAVTSLPDPKRGERLVVVHTEAMGRPPAEVVKALIEGPTPRLWIPGVEDFVAVEALPVLGSGKLDLKQLRQLARERRG